MWPWSPPRHPLIQPPRCAAPPSFPGSPTGPSCWSRRRCRRRRSRRTPATPDAESALAAYDAAAEAVAEGFSAKAARASGAATEVLTASAGLTRDKGLRQAVADPGRGRRHAAGGRARGRGPVRRHLHRDGRADGRARHRPARHRAPARRPAGGRARAGRRTARRPVGARRRRPRAGGHRRPRPGAGARAGDREGRRHQPHRDHRAPARHPVRGGRGRCARACRPAARCWSTRPPAPSTRPSTRPMPSARVEADRAARAAVESWTGPAETTDGVHVKLLANVADGESARHAAGGAGRGRRAVPHRAVLPRPPRRAVGRRAGRRSTARCSTPSRATDRYVVVRTLDAGSDKPIAFATLEDEENPALGVRGLRLALHNPGLLERQLDGIAAAASASRHRDVGDGADGRHGRRGARLRRAGPRPRAQGRRHGRGAERRAAGRPDARGRRLPVHRDQRPHAVHDGRRPARLRPRSPHRPLAAGRAPADRDHRGRRPAGRQDASASAARPRRTRSWPWR